MSDSVRPFEEALADLEKALRDLEEGDLGLDEALSRYERGIALVRECHARLAGVEQRITVLSQKEEE